MELREQFIKSAMDSCRHFNGIQNKTCKAGVAYQDECDKAMPCIPRFVNGRETWPCDTFEIMSQMDAEKEADERIISVNKSSRAFSAASEDARLKGFKKGSGGVGSIACPCCDGGKLRYSVASYNGHMHGRCTTEGCVSWMQ